MIEVLDREDIEFEAEGGTKAVVIALGFWIAKWIGIGALFHVGWRATG